MKEAKRVFEKKVLITFFNLGDRIPDFPIPLRLEDTEPIINLQAIINELYEQLGYGYFIDYNNPPPSPWSSEEVAAIKKV